MDKKSEKLFKFVKVKLIRDNNKEYLLSVKNIYEFKNKPPTDKNQYDSKKIYSAKFKIRNDTTAKIYLVKIGGLYSEL